MTEEDIIRMKDTGRNPFRTPDGYFENFGQRLMARMEAEGMVSAVPVPETKVVKMNPLRRLGRYAAAAILAGVCLGAGTYLYVHQGGLAQPADAAMDFALSEENLDEALDYEMLNNNQIAYYLTEAY